MRQEIFFEASQSEFLTKYDSKIVESLERKNTAAFNTKYFSPAEW